MTPFALLIDRCGLSHREAAAFLDVSEASIASMAAGRRSTPQGIVEELRALYALIRRGADQAIAFIEGWEDPPEEIELGLAADDHEAQSPEIGLPCVGAHAAMLGMVAAGLKGRRVTIVPRGSTPATAGAADAHERRRKRP